MEDLSNTIFSFLTNGQLAECIAKVCDVTDSTVINDAIIKWLGFGPDRSKQEIKKFYAKKEIRPEGSNVFTVNKLLDLHSLNLDLHLGDVVKVGEDEEIYVVNEDGPEELDYAFHEDGYVPTDFKYPIYPLNYFHRALPHNKVIWLTRQIRDLIIKDYNEKTGVVSLIRPNGVVDTLKFYYNGAGKLQRKPSRTEIQEKLKYGFVGISDDMPETQQVNIYIIRVPKKFHNVSKIMCM